MQKNQQKRKAQTNNRNCESPDFTYGFSHILFSFTITIWWFFLIIYFSLLIFSVWENLVIIPPFTSLIRLFFSFGNVFVMAALKSFMWIWYLWCSRHSSQNTEARGRQITLIRLWPELIDMLAFCYFIAMNLLYSLVLFLYGAKVYNSTIIPNIKFTQQYFHVLLHCWSFSVNFSSWLLHRLQIQNFLTTWIKYELSLNMF